MWGKETFVDAETGVNTAIRKVRQALKDRTDRPVFIQTISGKGYRFLAPPTSKVSLNQDRASLEEGPIQPLIAPSTASVFVKNGAEETAKGIGHTVEEGAKFTGQTLKESARAAEPEAKSAWAKVKDGASDFGHSVKSFFTRPFTH